ncbi:class I SAM-dependent methyltransferase [Ectothiorhodospiraceae bacterium 2226]|nr:class I SAM-dependent methyltransferase [Ectothiorhodospiraceae bacterium 2226]
MRKNKTAPLSLPSGQVYSEETSARGQSVSALHRWLVRRLIEAAGRPPCAIVLWNGETFYGSTRKPVAQLHVRDRGALFRLLRNPGLQFGELYTEGRLRIEGSLRGFLEVVYRAMDRAERSPLLRVLGYTRRRSNSLAGSRDNIHHHYDLGNEFYQLWLDTAYTQYTCAYYADPSMSLEQAQIAKLHHVCRKLQLKPGQTVVEAGCGWGGLARFMAEHYGVRVKAFNISHEQVRYARARAAADGLDDRVEYIEDDYRNIQGEYDAFVSVGMLEHVGRDNYRTLGDVVDRCLKPEGRGLIHTIGRNRPKPMNAWIERHIFPGAYPPTLREMMDIFEGAPFSVLDVENLRMHYARTLEHWLERYDGHVEQVREMFDEGFVRAWRLYLVGSAAAFASGELQLFQVAFARAHDNEVPATRRHVYAESGV